MAAPRAGRRAQLWDKAIPTVCGFGRNLLIHGENAHSRYFSEGAFEMLKGNNKELMIIPGANHCDLYDGGEGDYIPFNKLQEFFARSLA